MFSLVGVSTSSAHRVCDAGATRAGRRRQGWGIFPPAASGATFIALRIGTKVDAFLAGL